ncbi:YlaH-like family protein [Jeotgalicoccus huakuii]|uniref:YlaH-like family protein n=1 Tax=Jeotgalicoccus TaxID=227979 RepID=UPI001F11E236|nr:MULTISPECIES: YlaH-like family protein [Jeotgalicoccus]MCK1976578.1 YlaH-like family protein [Jeotgalicoccus huakuii]
MLNQLILLNASDVSNVQERLTFFGRLYGLDSNPDTGMWYLLITIFVLCAIVYHLGFARKVKWWQTIVIYILMFIGVIFLTFFGAFYPVAECLIVIAIILAGYRYRLHKERKAGKIASPKNPPGQ